MQKLRKEMQKLQIAKLWNAKAKKRNANTNNCKAKKQIQKLIITKLRNAITMNKNATAKNCKAKKCK